MEITHTPDADDHPTSVSVSSLEIESTGLDDVGTADISTDSLTIEPTSFGEVSLDTPAPPTAPPQPAAKPAASPPPPTEADMSLADDPADTEMLDFGSVELPESAIAPVIDTRPAKGGSLDSFELAADLEPEPVAPPPPPKAAAPKPVTPLKPIGPPPRPPAASPKPAAAPRPPAAAPKAAAPPAAAVPDFDLADIQESEHAPRKSTVFKAKALNLLAAAVQATPEDWSLRREYAEAMLEDGDRPGGIAELEVAMNGAENFDDLELAMAIADELGKLEPQVVKHHQKRVEYAFRRNDRPRLVEAYLTLADALMRNEQSEKARAVYQRVLELSPDNMQAQAAVETIAPAPAPAAAPPVRTTGAAKRPTTTTKPTAAPPKAAPADDGAFVNLGDWLRDDEGPKDTRMVVDEKEPTGDEDADFADMLKKFKQGVAENVDAEDYQSHYDLAIAFKEMGLLDEAIAGFQRALGSKTNRLPTYEALGECFMEKGQPKMAAAILQRGLGEQNATDEQLVGVLYLLGRAAEEQEQPAQALDYYQRVFVIDIQFRDVADRMSTVEKAAR
jgi:tetratricopeptide (TPR) repeat protein